MMRDVHPWRVEDSRVTYQDRWIKLRSDRCIRHDGRVIAPYHVLEYGTWVCVIALTPKWEIILTREYRHGAGLVGTGLPGGGVEPGEDPLEAARRELQEETGYNCARWQELGRAFANWANQTNQVVFVLGLGARKVADQALDANEDIAVVVRAWDSYLGSVMREPAQALHLAGLFLAARALGTANGFAAGPEREVRESP